MLAGVIEDRQNKAQQAKMDLIDKQTQSNQQQNQVAQQGVAQQAQQDLKNKMLLEHFMTGEIQKRNASLAWAKGNVKLTTDQQHSQLKIQEKQMENMGQ